MTVPNDELERRREQIQQDIRNHLIMIYAKGEKNLAVCGFSHRVMEIFNRLGEDFEVRNVLTDPALRPALVSVTQWPTIPQVFIGGEFVGGCDIVTELYESGELQQRIEAARRQRAANAPS